MKFPSIFFKASYNILDIYFKESGKLAPQYIPPAPRLRCGRCMVLYYAISGGLEEQGAFYPIGSDTCEVTDKDYP